MDIFTADTVLDVLVSAVVSLVVAYAGFRSTVKRNQLEIMKLEKQQQRSMTVKLYDLRLQLYPPAFEICEKIQRREKPDLILPREELDQIKEELKAWKKGDVSMIISKDVLETYYELGDMLSKNPGNHDGTYTPRQVEKIFRAKNCFMGALRGDLGLIYDEDRNFGEEDNGS